jgi:hypothetical protein
MSKIVVDQVQKPGSVALTLPTADGTAGQYMQTSGSGVLSFSTPTFTDNVVPADNALMYGSVFTASARGNIYSTGAWTSSGPNSTYQNATAAGTSQAYTDQSFNMFLGDGYPGGTSQIMYSGDFRGLDYRTILYSGNDRLGHNQRELFYYLNNTSYGGVSWHVMPVRNTTGSSITRTLSFMYSAYDTYNGAALGYYTPNAVTYAATTGGTWTQPFTATSNTITSSTASIVIPANTTVLVMLVTSHNYLTTYYFKESSMYYGLSSFFGTGLVCDLRMLNALALLRTPASTNSTSAPQQIYTGCATVYGNR